MSIIAEEIYSKNKAGHKRGEAGQREEGHHASSLKHWDKEAGGNLLRESRKRGRARVWGGGVMREACGEVHFHVQRKAVASASEM